MPVVKSTIDVAVIMGSDTDWPILKRATQQLKNLGLSYHVEVVSAHRTPETMVRFAKSAHENFKVIIAGAGGAAHLPGMVASLTCLPVIGVPILVGKLQGLDALVSIAQMPRGVPVATVGVDNGENAALLAAKILALNNAGLRRKLVQGMRGQQKKVRLANARIKQTRQRSKT